MFFPFIRIDIFFTSYKIHVRFTFLHQRSNLVHIIWWHRYSYVSIYVNFFFNSKTRQMSLQ